MAHDENPQSRDPKTALITTTINIPEVLHLYREGNEDVRIFVAGDRKTPPETEAFVNSLPNARYIPPAEQERWASSDPVSWNCIQRRNFALLEALEWGAEIIATIDDDNIPLDPGYFDDIMARMAYSFSGPAVVGYDYWFDVGQLLRPPAKHRGFPYHVKNTWSVKPVTGARVGVCAGLCIGDPDIDAVTRMAMAPEVHGMSELVRRGLVVDPSTWTVFNSQNTAFVRELAPFMFMFPGVGRYDDIYASLLTQWAMRRKGLHVHFGPPVVWQTRNQHNLLDDLRAELTGMESVKRFAEFLGRWGELLRDTHDLEPLLEAAREMRLLPSATVDAAKAWITDVEKAMG